ncbi:MAG: SiaB family protein kinase [Bacteroidales bacterium]
MDVGSIAGLLEYLHKDELVFAYSGAVSDTITHKIIELTQYNIDSSGSFVKFKNKISFLMAECYQNVARHGKYAFSEVNLQEFNGAFYVRSIKDAFYIASVNSVNCNVIDSITKKLDKVNSLTPPELRLLQKEVLSQGKLSERGGAGLGVIEMARRTGQKITYDFEQIDDEHSLFFIQLTIKSPGHQEEVPRKEYSSLDHMKGIHKKMVAENLIILHKGDFSEYSVLPIIQMIEKNILQTDDIKQGKQKLYNISVELLQNISMHAQRINGVNEALFVLKREEGSFVIGASNFIDRENVGELKDYFEFLKSKHKPELNALYRQKMKNMINEDTSSAGIGLIYLFRKSERINYSVTNIDNRALLNLTVAI